MNETAGVSATKSWYHRLTVKNTDKYTVLAQALLSQGMATAPCSVCVVRWRGRCTLSIHTYNHESEHMGGDGYYSHDSPEGLAHTFVRFAEHVSKDARTYLAKGTPLTGDPQEVREAV